MRADRLDLTSLQGWNLKCEKAGMRRVLMNLFGNSLKFTTVKHFFGFEIMKADLSII